MFNVLLIVIEYVRCIMNSTYNMYELSIVHTQYHLVHIEYIFRSEEWCSDYINYTKHVKIVLTWVVTADTDTQIWKDKTGIIIITQDNKHEDRR